MIYFKKITRKMNKYIMDKNEKKCKKLETNILKNILLDTPTYTCICYIGIPRRFGFITK